MRDMARARAAMDLAEALGFSGGDPIPPQMPQPPQPGPLPGPLQPRPQMPPQGALSMGQPGAPQQRPAMSPLQSMPSFKSPPVAAALQGAVGREGPIGFADGGFVVVRR